MPKSTFSTPPKSVSKSIESPLKAPAPEITEEGFFKSVSEVTAEEENTQEGVFTSSGEVTGNEEAKLPVYLLANPELFFLAESLV